jgi:hypothetical protein
MDAARGQAARLDAETSAGVVERLAQVDFGAELAAEGITTVALDADGNVVEHRPDGTSAVLAES